MYIKGTCIVCKAEKDVIDTISICSGCIITMREAPGISEETKVALKWLVNAQWGAIKTAKKRLEEEIAKHEEFKAAMKWICDDCDEEFAEPLKPDFGLDEGWVCPRCYSKNIREKQKR